MCAKPRGILEGLHTPPTLYKHVDTNAKLSTHLTKREGGMMEHVVDVSKWITVPPGIALCPQCGDELVVFIEEWDAETGEITEVGFDVACGSDEDNGDGEHQYWYDEWIRIDQKVYRWLSKAVRVDIQDW